MKSGIPHRGGGTATAFSQDSERKKLIVAAAHHHVVARGARDGPVLRQTGIEKKLTTQIHLRWCLGIIFGGRRDAREWLKRKVADFNIIGIGRTRDTSTEENNKP